MIFFTNSMDIAEYRNRIDELRIRSIHLKHDGFKGLGITQFLGLSQEQYRDLFKPDRRVRGAGYSTKSFTYLDVVEKFGTNPVCYLTGLPIDYRDGSTYQLDHYIATCKGGLSDLDNMRLCFPAANMMKRHHSVEELLNLCRMIIEHSGKLVAV